MLEGFEMNMDEFIDLCIMCGCDYTHSIGGVGPIKAFKLLKDNKNIEGILDAIKKVNDDPEKKQKYIIPENFLYEESRKLFKEPDVIRDKAEIEALLKWNKPQEEELKDFLINKKGFAEVKVDSGIKKLLACQGKKNQSRLDTFFKSAGTQSSTKTQQKTSAKAPIKAA